MQLFRIHINPKGGRATRTETFAHCLKHSFLGVGWRVVGLESTGNWATYEEQAKVVHPDLSAVAYIINHVRKDDLVWTRGPNGRYYLARVLSGWEYWTTTESTERDIDLANIFRCDIRHVETALVPGHVVAAFRAPRCIRRIPNPHALVYSQFLWNRLAGANVYDLGPSRSSDVFVLFDSEELEDVVFLYLQSLGWYLVPSSRKGDTMRFEYLAVHPATAEIALTQVKSGNTPISRGAYHDFSERIFLFQANGRYDGEERSNIICIQPEEIRAFLLESYRWLPGALRLKMDLTREVAGTGI